MLKDKLTITYNIDEVADSLEESIYFFKEHQIDSVEIRTIDGKNIAKLTLEETRKLKLKLNSNGLTISAIASPLFKWYSEDSTSESSADLFGMNPYLSRKEKEEMIQKIIEQACILETKKIRIFSGLKSNPKDHALPDAESELLIYALRIAKEKGVHLMLENEPVCYVSKLKDYIDMFISGKYEGLRSWFDIANVYEEGETISYSDIETLAPFMDYLHVKDPVAQKTHKYNPLGQGYLNYKRIFDLLERAIINHLYISIETHVKENKWNASHDSLQYLYRLLNTSRTRYVIVGLGRISRKHINAIKENDNCTLLGVCDIAADKAKKEAEEFDCSVYDSYEDIFNDPLVDVVSICTPHNTHINLAETAIKHGKRILCEKPLASSTRELNDFIRDVDHKGLTHVVFQNKFNQSIKKLYEFEQTKLGDPYYIAMNLRWWRDADYYRDWHGSKELSGGPLITQAIHSLEIVAHLIKGSTIKNVKATQIKTREEILLPDIIVAIVEFENGIICNIEVCLATRDRNLESSIFVVGNKGSMKVAGVALSEFVYPETIKNEDRTNENSHYYGDGHSALYKTHSNYCLGIFDPDINLLTRPCDLVKTLELIEAIERDIK
ncbi:MAG: Gfo/Idh/MocA family oxidoreductase [bacterium]